jgi:hypothetical protein
MRNDDAAYYLNGLSNEERSVLRRYNASRLMPFAYLL